MYGLTLEKDPRTKLKILCLGAHSDDIEIGCGGTILNLTRQFPDTEFLWVVFSASLDRTKEANRSADLFLEKAGSKEVIVRTFRDNYFPYIATEIKDYFSEIKGRFSPDLIFTHYRDDCHQDHRLIGALTWNIFRHHLVFEYEVPKYDGDLSSPNCFVPLDDDTLNTKIRYLFECFQTQSDNHWFCNELFRSLPRLRGMECALKGKYAEAFYCRKLRLFG